MIELLFFQEIYHIDGQTDLFVALSVWSSVLGVLAFHWLSSVHGQVVCFDGGIHICFSVIVLATPEDELRDWSLAAFHSGMTKGNYVFIYLNQQTADPVLYAKITSNGFFEKGDEDDPKVYQGLLSFFLVRFDLSSLVVSLVQSKF